MLKVAIGFFSFLLILNVVAKDIYAQEDSPGELLQMIPRNAMTVIMLNNKTEDEGLNALKQMFIDKFSVEKSEERQQIVSDISSMMMVKEIVGASFYTASAKPIFILALSVNAQRLDLIQYYANKINILFNNPDAIWYKEYQGKRIIYNPERFQKSKNKDFSCYVILDGTIIISNEYTTLTKVIENVLANGPTILDSEAFQEKELFTDPDADGLIFITNENKELTNALNSWKKEIGFMPLASSNLMQSLWFSFDLVDTNVAHGMIAFVPSKEESLEALKSDANFLMEALKRKSTAEGINFDKNIVSREGSVILTFELSGLSALFEQIISEDYEEDKPIRRSEKIVSKATSEKKGGMFFFVFIGAAIIFIIIVAVIKRRPRA